MVKYRILFLYCSWPTKRDYLLVCSTWFLALDPMLQTWERLCVRVLWWLRYPSQVPLKQERLVYMHFFLRFSLNYRCTHGQKSLFVDELGLHTLKSLRSIFYMRSSTFCFYEQLNKLGWGRNGLRSYPWNPPPL